MATLHQNCLAIPERPERAMMTWNPEARAPNGSVLAVSSSYQDHKEISASCNQPFE